MIRSARPWAQADVGASVALRLPSERDRCLVCDRPITPGEGVPTRYEGMTLVFRRAACRALFERDPERYLRERPDERGECDQVSGESPASEWCCER